MRRAWAICAVVWLGLGCGGAEEPVEPEASWGVQEQEARVARGSTRQVRPLAGRTFGRLVGVDGKGNAFLSLAYERAGVDLGGGELPGWAGLALAKYAPNGTHLWSRGFPTYNGQRPTVSALAVDAAGNLYVAGAHGEPSLSLGGEPLPPGPFLAKYGPDGTHLWSHPARLPGMEVLAPSALAVDEARGHVVLAVNFLDKGQSLGAALLGRVRAEDGAVLSVKPVVRWGRLSVTSLGLDPSGNIAVAGFFEGEVDLGGGPFSTTLSRSPFIARFTAEGRHVWSRGLVGAEGLATGVAVEASCTLVVGEYSGAFAFRGRKQVAMGRDAFVTAYGPRGEELWGRHFAEGATAVAVDGENRVVVTGHYRPGDSAGGSTLPFRAGGTPANHVFVTKLYRGSGHTEWSRGLFSDGVLSVSGLAERRSGEALLLTNVTGTLDSGAGRVTLPASSAVLLRLVR